MKKYDIRKDYIRVAGIVPVVYVGQVGKNLKEIMSLYDEAVAQKSVLVVTPELALTGYTIGDMIAHDAILDDVEQALESLRLHTENTDTALIVGAPLRHGSRLYNCAVVITKGGYIMVAPKSYLPNQNEFYEQRWYESGRQITCDYISIKKTAVPFGVDQLFAIDGIRIGVELCEDAWVVNPPHLKMAGAAVDIVCNLSASPELVGKSDFRRQMIEQISARIMAGYVYVSAGPSESTADIVMSGHGMIYENGKLLCERKSFSEDATFVTDIDVQHGRFDRRRNNNIPCEHDFVVHDITLQRQSDEVLQHYARLPFVPVGDNDIERLETILAIQAQGLRRAVQQLPQPRVVLGLSGGLDSTLALVVAHRAARLLQIKPAGFIHCLTMPARASTRRTQSNAAKLAQALGTTHHEISIEELHLQQLRAIHHDTKHQDVTYENTQARQRTALLFNYANMHGGLVLGTGDMSEIALGWCTYNGDHMSGYNVNASIPKTLVRRLTEFASSELDEKAKKVVDDILATPISPELVGSGRDIAQSTEDIVGPYELHDFFLYHFMRWGESPEKIYYLACQAFPERTRSDIKKWLTVFMQRFFANQWKREAMPNGPKVGTVSLSPRGDLRLPPGIDPSAILGL